MLEDTLNNTGFQRVCSLGISNGLDPKRFQSYLTGVIALLFSVFVFFFLQKSPLTVSIFGKKDTNEQNFTRKHKLTPYFELYCTTLYLGRRGWVREREGFKYFPTIFDICLDYQIILSVTVCRRDGGQGGVEVLRLDPHLHFQ